jgi:hypothetical protein
MTAAADDAVPVTGKGGPYAGGPMRWWPYAGGLDGRAEEAANRRFAGY